jgi:hypothetical protein
MGKMAAPGIPPDKEIQVRLCIRGTITYSDVFGSKYVRQFCHFYGGSSGTEPNYCAIHNKTTKAKRRPA